LQLFLQPLGYETSEDSSDEVPLEPSEDDAPLDPSEDDAPLDPSEDDAPLDPSELDAPLDPSEDDAPLDPSDEDAPLDPSELDAPLDPSEEDAPLDPSEEDAPLDPSEDDDDPPHPMHTSSEVTLLDGTVTFSSFNAVVFGKMMTRHDLSKFVWLELSEFFGLLNVPVAKSPFFVRLAPSNF